MFVSSLDCTNKKRLLSFFSTILEDLGLDCFSICIVETIIFVYKLMKWETSKQFFLSASTIYLEDLG